MRSLSAGGKIEIVRQALSLSLVRIEILPSMVVFYKAMFRIKQTFHIALILLIAIIPLFTACEPISQIPGSAAKVAKVDTDYVYEANVTSYVHDYREAQRTSISNFIGFPPDEILAVREYAIDEEVRKQVKRLPGVNISRLSLGSIRTRTVSSRVTADIFSRSG
jgi:hypothetical protein